MLSSHISSTTSHCAAWREVETGGVQGVMSGTFLLWYLSHECGNADSADLGLTLASALCVTLQTLQRSSQRSMKLQSTADRDPGEARKERAREDPQNYIKEQDIPTEEQFMHESVSKDLKSI